jgi:uncharacterized protein YktA (UPF0223 family)
MEKQGKDKGTDKNNLTTNTDVFSGFSIIDTSSNAINTGKEDTTTDKDDDVITGDGTADVSAKQVKVGETDEKDIDADKLEKINADLEAKAKLAEKNASKKTKKEADDAVASEENTTTETETTSVEDTDKSTFKPFVNFLTEKGILNVEVKDEDFKDNEDYLAVLIDKEAEYRKQVTIKSEEDALPEDFKQFKEFVKAGGDPKQFLDVYYGDNSWSTYKVEDEASQKAVIKASLKLAGWEDSEIESEVQDIEDLGKLEAKAKIHLPKLQNYEKTQKEQLIAQQAEYQAQQEANAKAYWDSLNKDWTSKEAIAGFKLTDKVKKGVWEHMTVVDKKTGKTGLQRNYETNKDTQFLYAYLDYIGWDVSKLEKQVASKQAADLRAKLGNYSDSRSKISKSGRTSVDTEDDVNPFGAFNKIK